MTKHKLMALFPAFSPKRAFRRFGEGEEVSYEVTGKRVRVALLADGAWDVFLCNTKDMARGLGTLKLKRLLATVPGGIRIKAVDGEAWWQSKDTVLVRAWLEANRVALGIAKRIEVSDEVREARILAGKQAYEALQRAKRPEAVHSSGSPLESARSA
jgi:hypothetical protein